MMDKEVEHDLFEVKNNRIIQTSRYNNQVRYAA